MDASDFNPSFATAAETADALRKKHISASELLNMTFQRIDRHNPALNAIVWENREEAVARAKHADDALAKGNASGTLHTNDDARKQSRTRFESNPEDIAAAASVAPHGRWLHETRRRLAVRALWQTYFESHDVFLLPTTITAAFPHDDSEPIDRRVVDTPEGKRPYARDMPYWISFATLAGVPATVAPVGLTGAGLPVGLQVVAPMWEDGTAIEFAALLSDRVGGFTAPPAFDAAIGA
jgi:Asp-tRNA(Asn)/Glu-tRNA(Gln) amidotransferase A subunit family amidase